MPSRRPANATRVSRRIATPPVVWRNLNEMGSGVLGDHFANCLLYFGRYRTRLTRNVRSSNLTTHYPLEEYRNDGDVRIIAFPTKGIIIGITRETNKLRFMFKYMSVNHGIMFDFSTRKAYSIVKNEVEYVEPEDEDDDC